MLAHFIFYVRDQEASTRFYAAVLQRPPDLHVPGMTEFRFEGAWVLGLMPEKGIQRLLGDAIPAPPATSGFPKAELYLHVDDPVACHERALGLGARALSAPAPRDWGDLVAYSLDPDGYVLAFAKTLPGGA